MTWPPRTWLRDLTGLEDDSPAAVQAGVADLGGGVLCARATQRQMLAGRLHLPSLADLRAAQRTSAGPTPALRVLRGDAVALHCDSANAGAVFQVASQANLLEMTAPGVPPEAGVARYWHDRTQGPACAMSCGAGLLWRAYLMPLAGGRGQATGRQVDTLADLGQALGNGTGRWWRMRNGYALSGDEGIAALSARIAAMDAAARDALRGRLRIGLQADTEVTLAAGGHRVSQVLATALPVAYDAAPAAAWEPLARLVLEAAYEATLRAAIALARGPGPARLFLTRLGGGAFGNDPRWIEAAIDRAITCVAGAPVEVALVEFG